MKHLKPMRNAIEAEKESYELYSQLKHLVEHDDSKFLCEHLALVELRYKKMLEELCLQGLSEMQKQIEKLGGYKLEVVDLLRRPIESYEIQEILQFAKKRVF
jgi:rubrerythrin